MLRYGIAFDIGTTTIVGSLIDLNTLKEIDTASLQNPQARFGKDILSRISAVTEDASLLKTLQTDVIGACNSIIHSITNVTAGDYLELVVAAGNSVMEHILLGISPASLARVPYRPVFKDARLLPAKDTGLDVKPFTKLYTFPLIGGFIGGDTVGVILSTGIHKKKGPSLAVDIGTNSEIVISTGGKLYAASAAAGPAFEGGHIDDGMTADRGAIQGVKINNDRLILDVIGNINPAGVCGTGLVDAAAQMLKAGIMDSSGRIKNKTEVYSNLANKIIEKKDGNAFLLSRDSKKEISVTQKDIRELQLAKGAIQAGMRVLMHKAKVDKVEQVYLAGAFGSNLKTESLVQIGVLKKEWQDKVVFVGDAALDGAKMAACSEKKRKEAEEIASGVKYLPLSGSRQFQKEFIRGMEFPEAEC